MISNPIIINNETKSSSLITSNNLPNNNQDAIQEAEQMEQIAQELMQLLNQNPPNEQAIESTIEKLFEQSTALGNTKINDPSGIIHALIERISSNISEAFSNVMQGNNGQAMVILQGVIADLTGVINALKQSN